MSSFQGRVERQRPAAPQRIKVGPSAHCTFTCLMCSPAASPGGNSGISVAHGSCVARASPTESHFKLFIGFVIRLFRKISRHTELLAHGLCVARKVSKSISNRRAIFNSLLDLSFGFSKRCLSIPSYLPQHCPNKLHFSLYIQTIIFNSPHSMTCGTNVLSSPPTPSIYLLEEKGRGSTLPLFSLLYFFVST